MKEKLLLGVHDKPEWKLGLILSVQHIFAMFGATILVPLLLNMSVSVALFCSGLGTLIYIIATKAKVPVYLGSSFAYISAVEFAIKQKNGDISAAQTGIILVGLIYVLVAGVIKMVGTNWIDKILPPIVIGPMIMVIGLSLAHSAVKNAGLVANADLRHIFVALVTFLVTAYVNTSAKGFFKIIPFLIGIFVGYLTAILVGIVNFEPVLQANWFQFPDFSLPFETPWFKHYNISIIPEALAILPLAIVTISEHIGDHTVLSEICGQQFLKEPGLKRTLIGDGVATSISALLGGPANTTYGENTGVIGMTRIASVSIIRHAAIIAMLLATLGKFTALISTIPQAVIGGMSIILYGVIASNGLKVMIEAKVDLRLAKNLIIASAMLVIGLGGAVLQITPELTLSGTALSALVGIILNLILPTKTGEAGREVL